MQNRYVDIMQPTNIEEIEEDPRSCEEIARDIWNRIRKKGGNNNGFNGISSEVNS